MNSRLRAALLTISAGVALPLLSLAPASAVTVKIGTTEYDVTVFKGAYTDRGKDALFQTPPAGQMPWWGDDQLAVSFAQQVYNQLGLGPSAGYGPVFAFERASDDILGIAQSLSDPLSQIDEKIASDASVMYAYVTPLRPAPSSVPGPLPIFGAAAAFGWSRQLRKRIADIQGLRDNQLL